MKEKESQDTLYGGYPSRAALISAYLNQGETLTKIGEVLGISRERVRQLCKKAGLSPVQGRNVRNAQSEYFRQEHWLKSLPKTVQKALTSACKDGAILDHTCGHPRSHSTTRRLFMLDGQRIYLRLALKSHPSVNTKNAVRYYRFTFRDTVRDVDRWWCYTRDGRLFDVPAEVVTAACHYIPEKGDGAWGEFRVTL